MCGRESCLVLESLGRCHDAPLGTTMSEYRRLLTPGGTVFLTLVARNREPLFASADRVGLLRTALRRVRQRDPFEVTAAVILPDHMHLLWTLPQGDEGYSRRIGQFKIEFIRLLGSHARSKSLSRQKHREATVWQRRFWEHTIMNETDMTNHLDYIHYNPVRHGNARCPHAWPFSSFSRWVARGWYDRGWGCQCVERGLNPSLDASRTADPRRWGRCYGE